jgi:indole-3-glycerol phosphate synthase
MKTTTYVEIDEAEATSHTATLVEVHDLNQVDTAVAAQASLLGVNYRDLRRGAR